MAQEHFKHIPKEALDEKIGCDKKQHALRSIANQPNHLIHWAKLWPEIVDAALQGKLELEDDFHPKRVEDVSS
jgi:hypothetical protein